MKNSESESGIRVTFNIPAQAAHLLKELSDRGNEGLRELGVVAVEIDGAVDASESNNLRNSAELSKNLFSQKKIYSPGTSNSHVTDGSCFGAPPSSETLEKTRKSIAQYLLDCGGRPSTGASEASDLRSVFEDRTLIQEKQNHFDGESRHSFEPRMKLQSNRPLLSQQRWYAQNCSPTAYSQGVGITDDAFGQGMQQLSVSDPASPMHAMSPPFVTNHMCASRLLQNSQHLGASRIDSNRLEPRSGIAHTSPFIVSLLHGESMPATSHGPRLSGPFETVLAFPPAAKKRCHRKRKDAANAKDGNLSVSRSYNAECNTDKVALGAELKQPELFLGSPFSEGNVDQHQPQFFRNDMGNPSGRNRMSFAMARPSFPATLETALINNFKPRSNVSDSIYRHRPVQNFDILTQADDSSKPNPYGLSPGKFDSRLLSPAGMDPARVGGNEHFRAENSDLKRLSHLNSSNVACEAAASSYSHPNRSTFEPNASGNTESLKYKLSSETNLAPGRKESKGRMKRSYSNSNSHNITDILSPASLPKEIQAYSSGGFANPTSNMTPKFARFCPNFDQRHGFDNFYMQNLSVQNDVRHMQSLRLNHAPFDQQSSPTLQNRTDYSTGSYQPNCLESTTRNEPVGNNCPSVISDMASETHQVLKMERFLGDMQKHSVSVSSQANQLAGNTDNNTILPCLNTIKPHSDTLQVSENCAVLTSGGISIGSMENSAKDSKNDCILPDNNLVPSPAPLPDGLHHVNGLLDDASDSNEDGVRERSSPVQEIEPSVSTDRDDPAPEPSDPSTSVNKGIDVEITRDASEDVPGGIENCKDDDILPRTCDVDSATSNSDAKNDLQLSNRHSPLNGLIPGTSKDDKANTVSPSTEIQPSFENSDIKDDRSIDDRKTSSQENEARIEGNDT